MARNISAGLAPRVSFPCTCNGCRGFAVDLYPGASEYKVIEATRNMGSHYFDEGTRRFFRSRVLGWHIMHDGDAHAPWGFLVRESKAAGWNIEDGREYRVSVWCRFGSLVAVWIAWRDGVPVSADPHGADFGAGYQSFTAKSSERALTFTSAHDEAVRVLSACNCHGCAVWGTPWATSEQAATA